MKYIKLYEEFNDNYNSDGFLIKNNGWSIKYNHSSKHDLIQRFKDRMFYDMPVKSSVKKEINNIIKEITNYFDNNYFDNNDVAIYTNSRPIFTILDINILNSEFLVMTFLNPIEMKVKKNTKIIKI